MKYRFVMVLGALLTLAPFAGAQLQGPGSLNQGQGSSATKPSRSNAGHYGMGPSDQPVDESSPTARSAQNPKHSSGTYPQGTSDSISGSSVGGTSPDKSGTNAAPDGITKTNNAQ